MPIEIKEADWKLLKHLHPLALERYCERILMEIDAVRSDTRRGAHPQYVEIFQILQRRERELARIFDDLKRSNAFLMLAHMQSHDLLTTQELADLTPETRDRIALLLQNRHSLETSPPSLRVRT